MSAARVFVGIPSYNRAEGLRRTIACLQRQTHREWVALISDNASPDPQVEAVARQACAGDSRISYHRHPENIGAVNNFRFLAERADSPYFMWAADDDLWRADFIEKCLEMLAHSSDAAMAFGTICNVNRNDIVIRKYSGFSRLTSGEDLYAHARAFLGEPEGMGKANLVYGLYRTAAMKRAIADFWDSAGFGEWGGDFVFVYGFVCRHRIVASDEVLMAKRIDTDENEYRLRRHVRHYFVPPEEYESYVKRHVAVAPGENFARQARAVLRRRRVESVLFKYLSNYRLVKFDWSQLGSEAGSSFPA